MPRIDLYVSPEEYHEVATRGACWDEQRKCWYLPPGGDAGPVQAWLGACDERTADVDGAFTIRSAAAYVARARWRCVRCDAPMLVIALYCRRGRAWGEPLARFSVHHVYRIDAALARQLARWRHYRLNATQDCYLNHCPRCEAPLDDEQLHAEPKQPFFGLGRAIRAVQFTQLRGRVRLCADVSVNI